MGVNLSLCSGYGGLDLAVEHITGNTTHFYAENDPFAAQVMAARFPRAINLGDITAIDWQAAAELWQIHTITAGFPCQGLSNAGLRKGFADARSAIWKNVAEAVRYLRPQLVFLENVAAIRSRGLGEVVADLAAIGYDARWTCLRAGDPEVGAPHPRDRWFCIAYPAAQNPDIAAWRERWPTAPGQATRGGHGPTLDDEVSFLLPYADDFGRHRWPGDLAEEEGRPEPAHGRPETAAAVSLLPTPAARDWKSGASNLLGTNSRPLNEVAVNLLPTPKASDGPHGGPNQRDMSGAYYLPGQAVRLDGRWLATDGTDYGPAICRWEAVIGRPAPEPTEPGTRGNRRLSPLFTEWLMGCREGWVTGLDLPRAQQLKILGNGVVTLQAVEAYRRLLTADLEAMLP